jgi:hypothetical protein
MRNGVHAPGIVRRDRDGASTDPFGRSELAVFLQASIIRSDMRSMPLRSPSMKRRE